MATDCGCHVVSVRVQHGAGVDMLKVAHCPLHKAAGDLLEVCKEAIAGCTTKDCSVCFTLGALIRKAEGKEPE